MKAGYKLGALALVGAVAVIAAAWVNRAALRVAPAQPGVALPALPAQTAQTAAPAPQPAQVAAHPATAQPSAAATRGERRPAQAPAKPKAEAPRPAEGKAGADQAATRKVTHFRVGNRNVKRIFADGERIWVATSGGVIRYSAASDEYRLYDARSGLRGESVVYVGRVRGRIAAGVHGGGLALLDEKTERWEAIGAAEGLADEFVADVLAAANGDVWIATGSGVNRVRGGEFRERSRWDLFNAQAAGVGLPSNRVYGLAQGRKGEIWVATEGGVARFHEGQWRSWRRGAGVRNEPAAQANPGHAPAPAGHAGGAHQGQGPSGNPDFTVAIAVDRAGAVWAGTLGGGLSRFDGSQWRHYSRADGVPGDHVFMLHRDTAGRLWIGTDGGLARVRSDQFEVMTTRDGLFGNAVFAMASTAQDIWVGGFGGLARIRGVN